MHEPLPVERSSEILQQLDPPLVDRDQFVEGGEDGPNPALFAQGRTVDKELAAVWNAHMLNSGPRSKRLDLILNGGCPKCSKQEVTIYLLRIRPVEHKPLTEEDPRIVLQHSHLA